MAEETILARIRPRRGTAAQWTSANPVLRLAELGYETDTGKFKAGNGVSTWTALTYIIGADGEAASIAIGAVEALETGIPPYVNNSGTTTDAILNFGLPRGNPGSNGVTVPDINALTVHPALAQTDNLIINRAGASNKIQVNRIISGKNEISRIADYTADNTPDFPDNPSGASLRQNNFTALPAGWLVNGGTPVSSFSNGVWNIVGDANEEGYYRNAFTGMVIVRYRLLAGSAVIISNPPIATDYGIWKTKAVYLSGQFPVIVTGSSMNVDISDIYMGTGLYAMRSVDRSGNGWNLLNTACVPVSDLFGRSFYLNGATSFLRTEQHFNTPSVFTFVCRWSAIENLSYSQRIFSIGSGSHLELIRLESSSTLFVLYRNGSSMESASFLNYFSDSQHTIGIEIDRTLGRISVFRDGVFFETKTGLTMSINIDVAFLFIGSQGGLFGFLKGILGNIQMHGRPLSAEEHSRYHINPLTVDSGVSPYPILPVFADNAAAIAGNLQIGQEYRTSTGVKMVRY
jgi:hypothetical protein